MFKKRSVDENCLRGARDDKKTIVLFSRFDVSSPCLSMCAQVAPSGECLQGYKPGAVVFSHLAPRVAAFCLC